MEGTELLKKIAITLFCFELIGIVLVVFTGTALNIPALNTLNNYESATNSTINNIASTIQTIYVPNNTSSCFLSNCTLQTILNFILAILPIIIGVLILFGYLLLMLAFVVFFLIPSLFSVANIGVFNTIFGDAYYLVIFVIGAYIVELILTYYNKVKL